LSGFGSEAEEGGGGGVVLQRMELLEEGERSQRADGDW